MADPRARARELARESISRGDVSGWFEQLYAESARDGFAISWVDLAPNPHLVDWLSRNPEPRGRALVVGCGYGDDAELLAELGLEVVAFDIAPSAIAACRARFPRSPVRYEIADVLAPSAAWSAAFDFVFVFVFVFEAYTVQVLPGPARARCPRAIGGFVSPGGSLLVVARSRCEEEPPSLMPWPLTRAELDDFAVPGLAQTHLDEIVEPGDPPVPRFVAEFARR